MILSLLVSTASAGFDFDGYSKPADLQSDLGLSIVDEVYFQNVTSDTTDETVALVMLSNNNRTHAVLLSEDSCSGGVFTGCLAGYRIEAAALDMTMSSQGITSELWQWDDGSFSEVGTTTMGAPDSNGDAAIDFSVEDYVSGHPNNNIDGTIDLEGVSSSFSDDEAAGAHAISLYISSHLGFICTDPTDPTGDFDNDGIPNYADNDDDNDGTPDIEDVDPFDQTAQYFASPVDVSILIVPDIDLNVCGRVSID